MATPAVNSIVVNVPLDPYFTVQALADYASLSVRQLRNLIADTARPLPHYRVGGRVTIRRSEWDLYAAQHRRVGVSFDEKIAKMKKPRRRRVS
jgi:hypothetical protein